MKRFARTLGLIALGATTLAQGSAAIAAETIAFTAGDATIRMEPIDRFCFFDRANSDHQAVWDLVDQQMTGARVFAALASCQSMATGGSNGLTVIFSRARDVNLSTAEVDTRFGFGIGDDV